MTVVTRFAPSPTGYLHIGGARTALFSWLYARAKGGKFLLRIEDTDKDRSTQEAIDAILDGLNWLGLGGDEEAILQSSRAGRHAQVAHELVKRGAAYLCPVTPEELQQRRDAAELLQKKKKAADGHLSADDARELDELTRPFRSPWRDRAKPLPPEAPTVVRLRMPDTGELVVKDHVQGAVSRKFADLDDLVLLRSDGTPTYMLAVVVDDHDMGVTHVIRGDDHFLNTFRQLPIYLGMGWPQPDYSHVPLIHGPDGKKLSKRHGATAVDEYRGVLGYLPEGMKNYLLRLPRYSDYRQWYQLRSDSRTFLEPWEPTWRTDEMTESAFRSRVIRNEQEYASGQAVPLFLFHKPGEVLLGGLTIGHIRRGAGQNCMIGYWMGARHAGKGHMFAALKLAIPYIFSTLELHRIEAACIPDNSRSIRLLEKAGFEREGYLRQYLRINGQWRDHLLFSLLSDDAVPNRNMPL